MGLDSGAVRRLALAVAIVIGVPQALLADDSHYQDFIVGGRALGLGGAFTSLANDASGIYYNPAGIADSNHSSVQLSTNLYGFERGSIDSEALTLPVPGVEEFNIEFTDLIIVPSSAGVVENFGRRGNDGLPVSAYALAVVVPSYRSFAITNPRGNASIVDDRYLRVDQPGYSRRVTDRTLWTSVGYARKFGRGLRFGVGAHYVFRQLVDVEEVSTSATPVPTGVDAAAMVDPDKMFQVASNDITLVNGNVVLAAGMKYRFDNGFTVGAALSTPSLGLHSTTILRFGAGEAIPTFQCPELEAISGVDVGGACGASGILRDGARSSFETINIDGAKSQTAVGWTLRTGANYAVPHHFTISVDLTLHGPVDYTIVDVDDEIAARLPFDPHVEREPVVNFNLGVEYLVVPEVSIAFGAFSNFSSSPDIPASPAERDVLPHVDMYGTTLALGYFGDHTLTRVGTLYSFGSGVDVVPENDVARAVDDSRGFRRVDFFQSFFYFFLSSTFRY